MLEKSHSEKQAYPRSLKPIMTPTSQSPDPNRISCFQKTQKNVRTECLKPIPNMPTKLALDSKQNKLLLVTYQDYRNPDLARRPPIRPRSKVLRLFNHEDFTEIGCRYISNRSALEKKSFITFLKNSSMSNQSTPIRSAAPIMTPKIPEIKMNCRSNMLCRSDGITNRAMTSVKQQLVEDCRIDHEGKSEIKLKLIENCRVRRKTNILDGMEKVKSRPKNRIMKNHSLQNIEKQNKVVHEKPKFHKKDESFNLTGWVY